MSLFTSKLGFKYLTVAPKIIVLKSNFLAQKEE